MVELGIPDLTTEQTEILCSTAENAARKYLLSKVSSKMIDILDISVEAEGTKPVTVTVEIDIKLTAEATSVNLEVLVKDATTEAHIAAEGYLRKLK